MDPLKRPLQIPASYPKYADRHNVAEIFSGMLENLLLQQPDDPLTFLGIYVIINFTSNIWRTVN